ncbi:MAG: acyl carrier protein [Planctomycetaceae bacterium]|nr:acyl carrier protein [Planctomycetaceae bacterium]
MTELTQRIHSILAELRPEVDYSESTDYLADGLLDSTDIVSLVAALDARYGISIDGTEILPEHFTNAETIAGLLGKYGVNP